MAEVSPKPFSPKYRICLARAAPEWGPGQSRSGWEQAGEQRGGKSCLGLRAEAVGQAKALGRDPVHLFLIPSTPAEAEWATTCLW